MMNQEPAVCRSKSDPSALLCRIAASLLGLLLGVAFLANVAQFFLKHAPALGGVGWTLLTCYTVCMLGVLGLCSQIYPVRTEHRIAAIILVATTVGKLFLVAALGGLPQTADRLFLLEFIDRWVSDGAEALGTLSQEYYDYPLWAGRAWPVLYPVRVIFPDCFVLATLVVNCFLSAALLVVIYRLSRRLVRRPLLPLAMAAVSPTFSWSVLEYGYQFQGALLLLFALAIIQRMLVVPAGGWRMMLVRSIMLGALLFLLHLQQGLDLVVLALCGAISVYEGVRVRSWARSGRCLLMLLVLPMACYLPLSQSVDGYFKKRDVGGLSSGFIGHWAMGWNLVTWGEYHGAVVTLDRQTPPGHKRAAMVEYVMDNLRSRPLESLVKLPFVKVVKLFQFGAASGVEEALVEGNRPTWVMVAKCNRLIYAPLILLLAAYGCRTFFRSGEPEKALWLFLVLGFVMAYTFFSETSPRYSFYFQFVIICCAAEGLGLACDRLKVGAGMRRAAGPPSVY